MLTTIPKMVRWLSATPQDLWLIGLMWMMMTICFEFGFFHFVADVSWEKLLDDYNIFAGRPWGLVLQTTLCGPRSIIASVRRYSRRRGSK